MTLRDLLAQRTGVGSVEWPYYWDPSLHRDEYLSRLQTVPLDAPFRARWWYSNANFVAAAAYLERKTGITWEESVQRQFLRPLAMARSGFGTPDDTRGYWRGDDRVEHAFAPLKVTANAPAGALVSTANDYARFLRSVLDDGRYEGGAVIPPQAVRVAMAPGIHAGYDRRFLGGPGGYAFGMFAATYRGHGILHHPGGYPGYTAHVALLPALKHGVAVFCNRNNTVFAEALALSLLDRVLGVSPVAGMEKWQAAAEERFPAERSNRTGTGPTRPWAQYAGEYVHPAWGTFRIGSRGDGLRISLGQLDVPLEHHRYDSFSFASMPDWERLRLRFDANFEGDIDGFVLDDAVNAEAMRFARVRSE